MSFTNNGINRLNLFDELSNRNIYINKIHPLVKLFLTLMYISFVMSFDKYSIERLMPFIFYPIYIFAISDIPAKPLIKIILFSSPIILGIGIFNPIFEKTIAFNIFGVPISYGWISFFSLIIKYFLTIIATLLLLSTTSIDKLAYSLKKIRLPDILILQFVMTYRYINLLLDEVARSINAYKLRAANSKGIMYKAWGSFAGGILIRSFDRAQRVYNAMKLKGFNNRFVIGIKEKIDKKDIIYLLSWSIFFVIIRFVNVTLLIGNFINALFY
ncbi:cobalt ECF transporter T component CbiQ [Caldicellulosiruptoraceae bacterium PP1]